MAIAIAYDEPVRSLVLVVALAGCDKTLSAMDNIYSRGADRQVLCAISVDNKNVVSADSIASGLDKAQVEGLVIHLYSHTPESRRPQSEERPRVQLRRSRPRRLAPAAPDVRSVR